jgi:S1-C subfamily serine protease
MPPVNRFHLYHSFLLFVLIFSSCRSLTPEAVKSSATPTKSTRISEINSPTLESISTPTESASEITIDDVEEAFITVKSKGIFFDPDFGETKIIAGRGSGFIIDPSGIAVTNNHVVLGAEEIEVQIGNDHNQTYSAELVASSECSNLALIDIDGEGFEYLKWAELPTEFWQEVYTIGRGVDQSSLSLSRGVIVNTELDGNTSISSMDKMIEYTIITNPLEAGSPILSSEGKVLGLNYGKLLEDHQSIGISHLLLKKIVDQILNGENSDYNGIAGQAYSNEDETIEGIWISSVQTGSLADLSGLVPGDVLISLNGSHVAVEGSIAKYCEILQSKNNNEPVDFEIYRPSLGDFIHGTLDKASISELKEQDEEIIDEQSGIQINQDADESGDNYFAYYFQDDLEGWDYFVTNGVSSGVSENILDNSIQVTVNNIYTYAYYIYHHFTKDDISVKVLTNNLGENNNNVSLICRYSDNGWYEFNVASNGLYWIYRYNPILNDPYELLWKGGSTDINLGQKENKYEAVCQANTLTLIINDVEVKTVIDEALGTGKVGFSISSYNTTPIIVEIDEFTASVP